MQDYLDVDTKNDVRVDQTATEEYAIHQFNDFVAEGAATLDWEGQTTFAPSSSTVFLQIYNHNTTAWETVDSDSDTIADLDFVLTANVADLTDYKNGSSVVSCRVYQLAQ